MRAGRCWTRGQEAGRLPNGSPCVEGVGSAHCALAARSVDVVLGTPHMRSFRSGAVIGLALMFQAGCQCGPKPMDLPPVEEVDAGEVDAGGPPPPGAPVLLRLEPSTLTLTAIGQTA